MSLLDYVVFIGWISMVSLAGISAWTLASPTDAFEVFSMWYFRIGTVFVPLKLLWHMRDEDLSWKDFAQKGFLLQNIVLTGAIVANGIVYWGAAPIYYLYDRIKAKDIKST